MYAAIDALVDKLDRQVLKHKEKRNGRPARSGSRGAPQPHGAGQAPEVAMIPRHQRRRVLSRRTCVPLPP